MTLALAVILIGFTLWLGLYLVARDLRDRLLRFAGLGLVSYALAMAVDLLGREAPPGGVAMALRSAGRPLFLLPALFWTGALLHFLAGAGKAPSLLARAWRLRRGAGVCARHSRVAE